MIAAVMQPYLFPYVGYYQLVDVVDHFVFLDDVTFIKQGWINRNQILANGEAVMFTVPLDHAGSHVKINDLQIHESYPRWREKFLKTLAFNYRHAPFWQPVSQLVEEVMPPSAGSMCEMAVASIERVMRYLGRPFKGSMASSYALPPELKGAAKVQRLCQLLGADAYYNLPGGRDLYATSDFQSMGMQLGFLEPRFVPYAQGTRDFHPGLSVLDLLMFTTPEQAAELLTAFTVTDPNPNQSRGLVA